MKTQRREADEPKLENAALKLPLEQIAALDKIAKAKSKGDTVINRQFLLRRAADAIVRYAEAHGAEHVPLEMEIQQNADWLREVIAQMRQNQASQPPPATPQDPPKSRR